MLPPFSWSYHVFRKNILQNKNGDHKKYAGEDYSLQVHVFGRSLTSFPATISTQTTTAKTAADNWNNEKEKQSYNDCCDIALKRVQQLKKKKRIQVIKFEMMTMMMRRIMMMIIDLKNHQKTTE